MDKWESQYAFWSSFGWPAYEENIVFTDGDEPAWPHITYQAMSGVLGQEMVISASLWDRNDSWLRLDKKSDEILKYIVAHEPVLMPIDGGGYLWIKLDNNTPFAQHLASGSDDDTAKRIYITVNAEFLTGD